MPELGKVFRGKREIRRESSGGVPLWAMCTEKPPPCRGAGGGKTQGSCLLPGEIITDNKK